MAAPERPGEARGRRTWIADAKRGVLRLIPRRLLPQAIELYNKYLVFGVRGVARDGLNLIDVRPRVLLRRRYQGAVLHYRRGTKLVQWIGSDGIWEPELSDRLVAELAASPSPVFVDVGANIGLITLNVLAGLPSTRIYAFEPGNDQHAVFEQTIATNGLADRVTLYRTAVGAEVGERAFVTHGRGYDAFDGFFDTGRAGSPTSVVVPVQTLDRWWHATGCPHVSVIKIDTEGAELWVLQGAAELVQACRPTLVLEIQWVNLLGYPYDARDIFRWLEEHGYAVETLRGMVVSASNIDGVVAGQENFIAHTAGPSWMAAASLPATRRPPPG